MEVIGGARWGFGVDLRCAGVVERWGWGMGWWRDGDDGNENEIVSPSMDSGW
jgi:hypothetical protein